MSDKPRLVLISLDAVGDHEVDALLSMPNFPRIAKRGTLMRKVDSLFISNTYPIHASIQTGVPACKHGIVDNDIQLPGTKGEHWRFHVRHFEVPTLPSEAMKADLSVCSLMFPVTGASGARYNFPEIAGKMSFLRRMFRTFRYGNKRFIFSSLFRHLREVTATGVGHGDELVTSISARLLQKNKADLFMIHLLDVDVTKHRHGATSPEAAEALRRLDTRIGTILDAAWTGPRADTTSVIIFSDHSCMDVHTAIHPNQLLSEAGISTEDAYFHCSHGCCFLNIFRPDHRKEIDAFTDDFLKIPGVARELTDEEMHVSGASREFERGFAAARGYTFGHFSKGQHGYPLDNENYQVFYAASGPAVDAGRLGEGGSLLDVCPLAADMLGLRRWPMDGSNRVFRADDSTPSAGS